MDDQTEKPADEKHTVEAIDEMIAKLRLLPPKDPAKRKLDKQESVKRMAQELIALQERGYTLEEIADSVRGVGLKITTPTLKTYLQRATKKDERKGSKTRRRSASPAAKTEATGAVPAARLPEAPASRQAETATSGAKTAVPSGASTAKGLAKGPAPPTAAAPFAEAPLRSGKDAFLIKDKDSY